MVLRPGILAVGIAADANTAFADTDYDSLRFRGQAPSRVAWTDFTNDGVADLQLYFDTSTLLLDERTTRLAVVGRTRSGIPVAGADSITVVPIQGTAAGPR